MFVYCCLFNFRYGGFSFGIANYFQYFNETQLVNIFIQYFDFIGINSAASALRDIYIKCCSNENNAKSVENIKVMQIVQFYDLCANK